MVDIAKSGTPNMCSQRPEQTHQFGFLKAGEAIAAGDACYIASTGRVLRSIGTTATAPAKCDGFASEAVAIGEAVTLYFDVEFRYGAGLTPGTRFFVGAAAGALADAATAGGTAPVAFAIDTTRIRVFQSRY
ncbi:MAG TPA: hypothetical protein VNM48_00525 [Chloroflexota bacterium]|nr:hypothetical protein [Chloroflexota bacterium]